MSAIQCLNCSIYSVSNGSGVTKQVYNKYKEYIRKTVQPNVFPDKLDKKSITFQVSDKFYMQHYCYY